MSKRQHVTDDYGSDGGFVEDTPSKSKKQKKQLSGEVREDADGNEYWELSGKRRVQISEFKGTTMVDVREFYEKDGKSLPGKKGIALSMDQYKTFIGLVPEIERVLAAKGIEVPRPQYDVRYKGAAIKEEDGDDEDDWTKRKKKRSKPKPNHEATSDEDEE